MKIFKRVISIAFVLFLSGCSHIYVSPDAESIQASDLAILENRNSVDAGFVIEEIDGKWVGLGRKEIYKLSPGEHSFTGALLSDRFAAKKITRWFVAAPGGQYELIGLVDTMNMRWGFRIMDKSTAKNVDYSK